MELMSLSQGHHLSQPMENREKMKRKLLEIRIVELIGLLDRMILVKM